MVDRQEIETVVRRGYELRRKNDVEGMVNLFHTTATFDFSGAQEASPIAARASGHAELRGLLARLIDQFDVVEQEILDLIIEAPRAAVHWRGKLRFRPTGQIVETAICDLWRIEGGKVIAMTEFCDTALVAKLLEGEPAEQSLAR